jgi:hypothetical protein
LRLQIGHAADLRSREHLARVRGRAARRAIAALLGSHHLGLSLTASEVQRGIARALSQLSRHGVSRGHLEGAAHVSLAAAAIDVLAQLAL